MTGSGYFVMPHPDGDLVLGGASLHEADRTSALTDLERNALQSRFVSGNDLLIGINALIGDLNIGVRAEPFEQAWNDLAVILGFAGQRPERDTGRGPDDLWALTDGSFHVIEAKSEVKESHPVYRKHAEQLSNSMDWFRQIYGTNANAVPVLVHGRTVFDKQAAIPTGCRVVTTEKPASLRDALRTYATALADADTFREAAGVGRLLASLRLTTADFVGRYTAAAMQER